MYQVFKNKRVQFKGIHFETYEKARQALRKHIRKLVRMGKASVLGFDGNVAWDDVSRNPVNYTNAGFSIRSVA